MGTLLIFGTHPQKLRLTSTLWSSGQRPYTKRERKKSFVQLEEAQTRPTKKENEKYCRSFWLTNEEKILSTLQKTWSLNR